jgi:hypothetical protein
MWESPIAAAWHPALNPAGPEPTIATSTLAADFIKFYPLRYMTKLVYVGVIYADIPNLLLV